MNWLNIEYSRLPFFTVFSATVILALGTYIFVQNPKRAENSTFFVSTLTVFLWLFGRAMCAASENSQLALLWYKRIAFLGVALLPVSVYSLVCSVLGQLARHKKRILATALMGLFFYLLANLETSLVKDVWHSPWGYHPQYGALGVVFITYFLFLSGYIFLLLASGFKESADDLKRRQIRLFFIALLLGYTGVADFLVTFGFTAYPVGHISILLFVFLTAYAVRKYGFLVLERRVALPVIFDAVSNFIIGIDNDEKMSFANRVVREVLGYDTGIAGQSVERIFGEQDKLRKMKEQIVAGRNPAGEEDSFLFAKDGSKVPVRFSLAPIWDKRLRGRPLGFVLTAADITERKQAEDALREHRDQLDGLVKERTSELKRVIDQLQQEITERNRAEVQLRGSYEKLQRALKDTIFAIAKIVEMRDLYTAGHQQRVSRLAREIAKEMNLSEEQINGVHMAAVVHDVGKIATPGEILNKPGPLTGAEFAMVETHPQVGYNILSEIQFPWPIALIVLQHHERMDGSGYPQGLRREDIVVEARIMGVADAIETMASHRPYRPALGIERALEEILNNRGKLYDAEVVDACLKLFREKGFTL